MALWRSRSTWSRDRRLAQEQAARRPGANARQTFLRITLPSITWAVVHGVVLSLARPLGEFGAVNLVSGTSPGDPDRDPRRRGEVPDLAQERAYVTSFMLILASIAILSHHAVF